MAPKHLALLRHAKSSWSDPQLEDRDRPLAPRGRGAATRMGVFIQENGLTPELVLCSSLPLPPSPSSFSPPLSHLSLLTLSSPLFFPPFSPPPHPPPPSQLSLL